VTNVHCRQYGSAAAASRNRPWIVERPPPDQSAVAIVGLFDVGTDEGELLSWWAFEGVAAQQCCAGWAGELAAVHMLQQSVQHITVVIHKRFSNHCRAEHPSLHVRTQLAVTGFLGSAVMCDRITAGFNRFGREDQDLPVEIRFLSAFSGICAHFRPRRHLLSATEWRTEMADRFAVWRQVTAPDAAA
jgi:hypothetical protein